MKSVMRVLTVLLVVTMLIGCGGGNTELINIPIDPVIQNEITSPPVTTWPAGLPIDAVQPWEELGSNGKVLSATGGSTEFIEGPQTHRESGDTSSWNGALRMASGDVGAGNLSFATYRIPLGGSEPGVVSVDAHLRPMGDGNLGGYFVGLADYGNNSWQWFGPVTDAHWRISSVQVARGGASYLTGIGNVFVCVVAHDGAAVDVVGVGVDPVDLADTTAPDAPGGLMLTPVASGLEVNWVPVGGSDVAGYKVYFKGSAFTELTAQFADTMVFLHGRTFILDAQEQTWVALSAVDKSGNESAISTVESATPLVGTAPGLGLEIDTYSTQKGARVILTATGAGTYDWDLDGDGFFDIMGDGTGTMDADTSQTGLIRPLVRGIGADSSSVALSAVSVIVSSNARPVAVANVSPASGDAPHAVVFAGGDSTDFDGSIVGGGWDFDGDGIYDLWSDDDIVHVMGAVNTYTIPGVYNAKLRVVDNEGAWDVDTVAIVVNAVDPGNETPVAALSATPTYSDEGVPVTLDASGSTDGDGTIVNYEWDFDGNGTYDSYGSGSSTSHTYASAGVFSAMVRVTDNDGAQDTATAQVVVMHGSWTMRGHDNHHTGCSPYIGAQTNNIQWSFTTGFEVYSPPVVGADGTVYVGDQDGYFYAINPDGTEKWSFTTMGGIESAAAIGADGTVYVGGYDNKLYAINPYGTEKWSFNTGSQVYASPAIGADGTVYVGSRNDNLYAINPDGTEKWSYTAGGDLRSSPAIGADGTVYVGSRDANLYAINPDGTEKWSYFTGDYVQSSPAIGADGTVYVGSNDNNLYAINPDGSLKWSYTTGYEVNSSPAIGSDGTVYVGSDDDNLYAINPDGSLKWSYTTGDYVNSSPAIGADGTVYVGSNDNNFYAINPDGTLLWSYTAAWEFYSSPAIGSDGTVYVGNHDGKLYAFGTGTGNTPPVADVTSTPSSGNAPVEVDFDASGSTDSDGEIVRYDWDLDGDGNFDLYDGGATPSWTYTTPDYYNAAVRVTDNVGAQDSTTVMVTARGWATTTVDWITDADSTETALAVVDGNPAIAYEDDDNSDLMYVRATDARGSDWGTPVVAFENTGGGSNDHASLLVVAGNPAICYRHYVDGVEFTLNYVRANDATGSSWGTPVVLDTGKVGRSNSLVIVDGNPAISYIAYTNKDLKYVRASDATGSSWNAPVMVDSAGYVTNPTSMMVINGNPAIAYYDGSAGDLMYVRASDAGGTAWNAPQTLDSAGGVGYHKSLEVVAGYPAICYNDGTTYELRYIRATDASGTAWAAPVVVSDSYSEYCSLAVIDGNPAISFSQEDPIYLYYVRATDSTGSTWAGVELVDPGEGEATGLHTSLVNVNGYGGISYTQMYYDAYEGDEYYRLKYAWGVE